MIQIFFKDGTNKIFEDTWDWKPAIECKDGFVHVEDAESRGWDCYSYPVSDIKEIIHVHKRI